MQLALITKHRRIGLACFKWFGYKHIMDLISVYCDIALPLDEVTELVEANDKGYKQEVGVDKGTC